MKNSVITPSKSTYADWRQGDYVLGEQDFIYRFNSDNPVTPESFAAAKEGGEAIVAEVVSGLVVVSQTCDIVKDPAKRPYVEVAPIVTASEKEFLDIKSGSSPRFATIESLESRKMVVDLDRLMTIEKPVLEQWTKTQGFTSVEAFRKFSEALSRKRMRPAFPDDFNEFLQPLRKQIVKKHGNNSDDGRAMAQITEIRVLPEPDWSSSKIKVHLLFFLKRITTQERKKEIDPLVGAWLEKLDQGHSKYSAQYRLDYYSEFNAEEYILSDRLDYDYLSE